MTKLRVESFVLPAANFGPENPLPVFRDQNPGRAMDFQANHIPPEDRDGLGWALGSRVLPYRIQDGYDRVREPREFLSVVLENEFLRVRVLPEVGGKVWSIFAKPENRELLLSNPVYQPGNLALRNAWTSGGIEWNIGQLGHNYHTCETMHAGVLEGPEGAPVLRLYAWERVKRVPYHLDLCLPGGSRFLFVRVRIINPHDHDLPMYWWTNLGVPEYPGGRVIAPADTTYHGLKVRDSPVINGIDYSYCTQVKRAYDLFFRIPPGQRPWEVSVDNKGAGILHTSTVRLRGRKLFAWGMNQGGRRWQEFLHAPGYNNKEIQAGLAYTQFHSVRMPAGAQWTWTEAMGYFAMDSGKAHSANWQEAYTAAGEVLENALPQTEVERMDGALAEVVGEPAQRLICRGAGWAMLELQRAAKQGDDAGIPSELVFEVDDLTPAQAPWLALLEQGALPETDPATEPGQFQIQLEWQALLEDSLTRGGDHWLTWLHLGVMKLEAGDADGARSAWETSLQRRPSSWAWRNLAVWHLRQGDVTAAVKAYEQALRTGPTQVAIAVEYSRQLLRTDDMSVLGALLVRLPKEMRGHERLRLAAAWVALHEERFDEVRAVLQGQFATIQEGERSLSDLWFALHEREAARETGTAVDEALKVRVRQECPPPWEIDFRMSLEGDDLYIPPQTAQ